MEALSQESEDSHAVQVNWADRWQVYQRLQELAVPCRCATGQPLLVRISDVTAAVQLWSVLRQFTSCRQDLVWWLERCWQQELDHSI